LIINHLSTLVVPYLADVPQMSMFQWRELYIGTYDRLVFMRECALQISSLISTTKEKRKNGFCLAFQSMQTVVIEKGIMRYACKMFE
jgi:hypothetical protein